LQADGRTKLNNTTIERKFSSRSTTRNWNGVKTLLDMVNKKST
jgi:uncharacterized protein (DUF1697 family)